MNTPIYRMVHVDNLPRLLEWGGDWSSNETKRRGLAKRPIHHADIMDRREQAVIRIAPGGVVADYVPFYFGPLSPMLFAIKQGKVAGCNDQKEIVYLKSTAEAVSTAGLPFVFTDGHAIIGYTRQFSNLTDLDKVPWDVIRAQYWNNFPDGRCKRQSEFLVHNFFPLSLVSEIITADDSRMAQVQAMLSGTGSTILAKVCRQLYF